MDYIPKRIFVKLRPAECQALAELAEQEQREPREQAALLIRRQLEMEALVESLPALDLAVLVQVAKDEGLASAEQALGLVIGEWVALKRAAVGVS